ncbi:hypothetical protein N0V90_007275 [Kalmusia sp. IMI 367209]|nr:hypothetical protein N0V90_007275 [Kalmusia sp. IMI 367209]
MPRRQYVADLKKAEEGISQVKTGGDDGEFTFLCLADGKEREFSALIPDVSDYPSGHEYMLFVEETAPMSVANALAGIADSAFGKTIHQLLELTSRVLESTDNDGDQQMLNSQEAGGMADEDSDDEVDDFFPDDEEIERPFSIQSSAVPGSSYAQHTPQFRSRIRSDLRNAKAAGFKVGHLGSLLDGLECYVTLSCRISKLGISEEAMQAWQVEPSEYLIVIFSYPNGYKTIDDLMRYDPSTARRHFGMRIGISTTYKPTMQEAIQAFTILSKDEEMRLKKGDGNEAQKGHQPQAQGKPVHKGFRNSFISRPLHDLLENRFPQLLKYRYNGMAWSGAEEFYHDVVRAKRHSELGLEDKYMAPETTSATYPSLITADHITDSCGQEHSLPLVGMQFVLRHFVRCTEFCLICFRKMSDELQAIKPYVCDSELCLYQYMSLGFGPSIEHEILSQPKVVDLLVSFCYVSAYHKKLNDFPNGLRLMVPPPAVFAHDYCNDSKVPSGSYVQSPRPPAPQVHVTGDAQEVMPGAVRYSAKTNEILFDMREDKCPFRTGDWMVIRVMNNTSKPLHCRVIDTSLYPTVAVSEPIVPTFEKTSGLAAGIPPLKQAVKKPIPPVPIGESIKEFKPASFYVYDQNFDALSVNEKCQAINGLLDLLPTISEMKEYLLRRKQSPLSSWVDRLSPATLGLLRWIIASNRACIMQVDDAPQPGHKGQERLYGMPGWTQFRFAMGTPDKERRFVQSVRDTAIRKKLRYETLFAWHGSPLFNWHSIIREGLHFRDTANGRAYGHGVYHSLDVNTSLGYAGIHYSSICWPMSELKVSSSLALNEIVAAPDEYVSKSPHLVVAQLDWIQTRYLFVKTGVVDVSLQPQNNAMKEVAPQDPVEQDSTYTSRGVSGPLVIPRSAIPSHRSQQARTDAKTAKRRKTATGLSFYDPVELDADDDNASIATLDEDRIILEEYDPNTSIEEPLPGVITPNSTKGKGKATNGLLSRLIGSKSSTVAPTQPLTDYVPGTLDYSHLTMLAQPAWATPHATRRLMQDFKQIIAVQNSTPLHELGWHIDEDKSCTPLMQPLPLAQDMKKKGLTSVVLEIRFGKDYPMSPPFVRVVRPRFLGFQQGGGGHVTAGGALCMQLLTNDGWSAVSSIESVLLQVRMAMSSLDPKPARLENSGRSDYGVGEAVEAYVRACNAHGWTMPPGFRETAWGGASLPRGLGFL